MVSFANGSKDVARVFMQRFTAHVNGRVVTAFKILILLDLAERFGLPTLCEAASRVHAYTVGRSIASVRGTHPPLATTAPATAKILCFYYKCEYRQAKWNHLAPRKMRPKKWFRGFSPRAHAVKRP